MPTRKRTQTFYCRYMKGGAEVSSGVEIAEAVKRGNGSEERREGRIGLRFFNCREAKETQIFFLLAPHEAFSVYFNIVKVVRAQEPVKVSFVHSFEKDGAKVTTTVCVEKWARDGKAGYAFTAQRGKVSHNISLNESDVLCAGEFLKFLSCIEAYEEGA